MCPAVLVALNLWVYVTAIGELGEQEGDWGLCSRRSLWEGGGAVTVNLFLHQRWWRRVSLHNCQDRREWDCVCVLSNKTAGFGYEDNKLEL